MDRDSTVIDYLLAGGAAYIFIFLKAFQQRNVAHYTLKFIMPTSYFIACVEVFVVWKIAQSGWHLPLVFALGTGGGLGALSATIFHRRFISNG